MMHWLSFKPPMTLVITVFLACHVPAVIHGHDIWLQPDRFVLEPGERLVVRQFIGPELARPNAGSSSETRELPFLWHMTPQFSLIRENSTVDLLSELPNPRTRAVIKPVLERHADTAGMALVAMEHRFVDHSLTPNEFGEYLEHEGLTGKFGNALGQRPVERERYRRALKSLIRIGKGSGDLHQKILGHPIEIVVSENPYELDPGAEISVKALYQGQPLNNQRIVAHNRDPKGSVSKTIIHTDTRGIAGLKLSQPGLWLLRLVHLIPCGDNSGKGCSNTDWNSYWASYTFQLD